MKELYACLCVREFPAQAMLRLRPELRESACVVMEGDPPVELVCSLNRRARRLGLVCSMTKVEVETFEHVAVLKRSVAEESAAREALLECAGRFSPRVEECSTDGIFLCVIDIAGTEKLFGAPEVLANSVSTQVRQLGFSAYVAVSHQFHTAVTAANGLGSRNPVQVIPAGKEKEGLAHLPLSVLHLTPEQAEIFSMWGIRTLGMLAELPQKGLIARVGRDGKRLHELAQGQLPHLFRAVEPAFALSERMEFDSPVEMLDALLFAVNVMLEHLILRATARVFALAEVTVTLQLEGGETHSRTVRPALPSTDRQMWLKLLHLDLEAHPPGAAILAATVTAEPGSMSTVQLGLFSPQLPEPSRLDVTLARIYAIVGEENAGRAVLKDTHAPDAFQMEGFEVSSTKAAEIRRSTVRPARRQIRPAENITITTQEGQPKSFYFRNQRYIVERAYGPWQCSGDWWNPSLWGHEQWDLVAHAQSGEMLCCCVVRDILRNTWEMAALYD